jgi:hypothetical protein
MKAAREKPEIHNTVAKVQPVQADDPHLLTKKISD